MVPGEVGSFERIGVLGGTKTLGEQRAECEGREAAVSAIDFIKACNSNNSYMQHLLHSKSTKTRMTLRKSSNHELEFANPELWQCPLLFCHESKRDNRSTVSKHTWVGPYAQSMQRHAPSRLNNFLLL
jgi:hypothetical protein